MSVWIDCHICGGVVFHCSVQFATVARYVHTILPSAWQSFVLTFHVTPRTDRWSLYCMVLVFIYTYLVVFLSDVPKMLSMARLSDDKDNNFFCHDHA